MVAGQSTPSQRGDARTRDARTTRLVVVVVAVVSLFAVLVVGGYVLHWRWTGLSSSVTLWDWLQVLALPVGLAMAPILMRRRHHLRSRHRRVMAGVVVAFAALVVAGYTVPIGWTGFTGNTLWDWLSLLLLPSVVATASLWATSWPPTRRHVVVAASAVLVLLAVAVPGYLAPWRWTGFAGNTAWDWVKLLLLPLLVPLALVPGATRYLGALLDAAALTTVPTAGPSARPHSSSNRPPRASDVGRRPGSGERPELRRDGAQP